MMPETRTDGGAAMATETPFQVREGMHAPAVRRVTPPEVPIIDFGALYLHSSNLSLTTAGLRPAPSRGTRAERTMRARRRGDGPLSRPVARPSKSDAL